MLPSRRIVRNPWGRSASPKDSRRSRAIETESAGGAAGAKRPAVDNAVVPGRLRVGASSGGAGGRSSPGGCCSVGAAPATCDLASVLRQGNYVNSQAHAGVGELQDLGNQGAHLGAGARRGLSGRRFGLFGRRGGLLAAGARRFLLSHFHFHKGGSNLYTPAGGTPRSNNGARAGNGCCNNPLHNKTVPRRRPRRRSGPADAAMHGGNCQEEQARCNAGSAAQSSLDPASVASDERIERSPGSGCQAVPATGSLWMSSRVP